MQVGLRGYRPPADVVAWMREQGDEDALHAGDLGDGIKTVIDRVIDEALDGPEYVYLRRHRRRRPGFAPGTGTPEPGGMAPVDLLRIVRRIALDTRGRPRRGRGRSAYDHADNTANNGHRVIWEALAGMG